MLVYIKNPLSAKESGIFTVLFALSVKNKLCKFNGVNDNAVLIYTHIAGSDFVDKDNLIVVIAEFKLDIP